MRGIQWKASTYVFLRQATHKLAEFGTIGVPDFRIVTTEATEKPHVPQSAQRTRCTAGLGTNSMFMGSAKMTRRWDLRDFLYHWESRDLYLEQKYCTDTTSSVTGHARPWREEIFQMSRVSCDFEEGQIFFHPAGQCGIFLLNFEVFWEMSRVHLPFEELSNSSRPSRVTRHEELVVSVQ